MQGAEARGAAAADAVQGHVAQLAKLDPAKLQAVRAKVKARQAAVGYPGDMDAWIKSVTPPDRV
jgi:hypothetical protein